MKTWHKKTIATVMVVAPLAALSIALTSLWWTLAGFGLVAGWELGNYIRRQPLATQHRIHTTLGLLCAAATITAAVLGLSALTIGAAITGALGFGFLALRAAHRNLNQILDDEHDETGEPR